MAPVAVLPAFAVGLRLPGRLPGRYPAVHGADDGQRASALTCRSSLRAPVPAVVNRYGLLVRASRGPGGATLPAFAGPAGPAPWAGHARRRHPLRPPGIHAPRSFALICVFRTRDAGSEPRTARCSIGARRCPSRRKRRQRRSSGRADAFCGRHTAAAQKKPPTSDSVACASAATGSPSVVRPPPGSQAVVAPSPSPTAEECLQPPNRRRATHRPAGQNDRLSVFS